MEIYTTYNINFIEPNTNIIHKINNKTKTKTTMMATNIPLIPNSNNVLKSIKNTLTYTKKINYPMIMKTSTNNNERNMHICNNTLS